MPVKELIPGVHPVGAIDWDRRLFDELIPLPDGTSYNAYLVKGEEKIALVDTVDPRKTDELLNNLRELGLERIDYVISNHAEQDHSGAIPAVLKAYPGAKVVANRKCKDLLMNLLLIPEDAFITVVDGEELSLGGKTLRFIFAPWVHWPETMLTYLVEDKLLFPCDLFGSHLATSELFVRDKCKVYEAAKRYYAEIMMPFRNSIKGHLRKLRGIEIKLIAPSHGPIHDDPSFILDAYRDWVSDEVKDEVVLVYVSMHGSTRAMVDHLVRRLLEREVTVKPFNLTVADIGELAMALVDAAGIVIATPTVLIGPHPSAVYAAYLTNALRPKLRFAAMIASYGWGGKAADQIKGMLTNLKVDLIEPVLVKGYPKKKDLEALDRLAEEISNRIKEV